MGHPVRSGPILRWRVLAGARASTRLRMASYPIAFSPLPLLVLASFEPSFPFVRTVWAGLVAMHFSMVIFGVEFMARHAAVDRLYELDERGIRLGQGPRSIGNVPWRTVRSVRVRIRGREEGRGAFVLRAGLRIVALPVDESQIPGLADRVAAAVARLAPSARRTGGAGPFTWNPAAPWEGDFSFRDRGDSLGPAVILGVFGPLLCLQWALVATYPGIIPSSWIRFVLSLAYLSFAGLSLALSDRMVRTAPARRERPPSTAVRMARWTGYAFTSAVAFVAFLATARM